MKNHPESQRLWRSLRNPECTECELCESAQTICLLGDGPVPCNAMIVGEAPGYREDNVEIPFSGKSGIFLRKTLIEIGLDPRKIFITNVVACRPPGNRTPTSKEAKTCASLYLDKQVAMVKPKVILLLGNTAVTWAKGKKSAVTKLEGTTFRLKYELINCGDHDQITCVPSRHPSAVLRAEHTEAFPFVVQQFRENLLLFKRSLNPESEEEFEYQDAGSFIYPELNTPIYTDIETNGLNPFKPDAKLWSVALSSHPDTVYCDKISDFSIKPILKGYPIMAHRGTFEGTWLRQHYGITPRMYYDTKLGANLMNENEPSGLKYQCIKNLGVDPWDEEQDWQNPVFSKLLPYNARDSVYGLRLYREHQLPFLRKHPKVARLMKYVLLPAEEVLTEMICNGFHIDMEAATEKLKKCQREKKQLNDKLSKYAGHEVNPGSPKQMCWLLYDKLKLKCPVKTRKNKQSTSEAARIRLAGKHQAVAVLDEWHKWEKYEGTYLGPWIRKGPVLHATYDNTGTDTGRLSSSMVKDKRNEKKLGAVIHQCPRDPFIRNVIVPRGYVPLSVESAFGARPDDWCILAGDVSQGELRLVAHSANDPTMIEIFQHDPSTPEGDIHYQTARTLKEEGEIDKETRKKAKAVNFGFVYKMFAKKFILYAFEKFGVKLTLTEGEEYRERFFHKYNRLEAWHSRVENFVSQTGFIDSILGRRRHLPETKYGSGVDEWFRREKLRQAVNSPIQGALSDLTQFIAALVCSYSLKWDFKMDRKRAFPFGTAHDNLLFEVRRDYVKEFQKGLLWTVKNLPLKKYFDLEMRVPLVMDTAIYEREWEGKELKI